jgi:hypothetical protein
VDGYLVRYGDVRTGKPLPAKTPGAIALLHIFCWYVSSCLSLTCSKVANYLINIPIIYMLHVGEMNKKSIIIWHCSQYRIFIL